MSAPTFLPELPAGWEETRSTLHAYALSVGAIPRAYADAHPKWWHVSLDLVETGLETDPVPLADKESLKLRMDLTSHEIVVTTTGGDKHTVSMTAGLTATELAERLMGIASSYGLRAEYYRDKFENDDARAYDPSIAETFYAVMSDVAAAFEEHRATLSRDVSPIQVWPHGFDLAFEWYGTRVETHEENGEVRSHPSQLNLGFYPAGRPYFYSNPWPFDTDSLLGSKLPHGAQWHTDGWEGTILYYDQLQDDPDARKKLLEYAAAVYDVVAPTLAA